MASRIKTMPIISMAIVLLTIFTQVVRAEIAPRTNEDIKKIKASISARYRMLVETTPQYTQDTKTLLWLRTTDPGRLKEYDKFFNAALIYHSYAIKSLDLALCRLNKKDVEGTKKFIEKSNDYQSESIKHIQSANLVLQKGIIKGYENAKWTIEILGASTPWSDQIISGLFLIMDFRMDEALYGENKAERNLLLKLLVTAAFEAIPVKEAVKETALKQPEINAVLTNLFKNPQHREKIIEISARLSKKYSKHITAETIKFILDGARFAIEYTPSNPSPTSFPQICNGPFPAEPTTVSLLFSWKASAIWSGDFNGPIDSKGRRWFDPDFDDSNWTPITLPDSDSFYSHNPVDRFYRASLDLSDKKDIRLSFSSDDGIWIYVNGRFLGNWGGQWRKGGCVNNPLNRCIENNNVQPVVVPSNLLFSGKNIIAVRVSNGGYNSYFDMRTER